MSPTEDVAGAAKASPLYSRYGVAVDSQSAREILAARMAPAPTPQPTAAGGTKHTAKQGKQNRPAKAFELDELPPVVTDLVQLLASAGEAALAAVPRLQHPAQLTDSSVELERLGRQAREAQRQFVVDVSTKVAESGVLVRRVAVAQSLRRAVESFEDLAHALQTVAVKEG